MVGHVLLKEIEDLLLDKLDRQATCLNYYEQIDASIRHDMLLKIFDQIDHLENEIQSMDLLFLSKFGKFKLLNGVKDISDIMEIKNMQGLSGNETSSAPEKQSLKLIKKAIVLIAQRERALDTVKNETHEIRQTTETKVKKTSRENKAHSAYRNINK